jgi:uncharacterized membrane protein YgaE (UPF0421/DUF939 family)
VTRFALTRRAVSRSLASRTQWLGIAGSRLRDGWRPVVEATAAATIAWLIATRLVDHPQPFFAPAAALIVLGQARGQRTLRAVEVVLGVAGGVLVADVVAQALGPRTTWTIFAIILVTLTFTVVIGASTVVRVQMAVSALYVAVVTPSTDAIVPFRFVDALVGGGVALVVNQLVRPRNPLTELAAASHLIFEEVAGVIADAADSLERHDEAAARAVLTRARSADALVGQLRTAVLAAREALWVDVHRRRRLTRVVTVEEATAPLDYLVRNMRVLTRAAIGLNRLPAQPPPQLVTALRSLAVAVRAVDQAMAADLTGDQDAAQRHAERGEELALDTLRTARHLLTAGAPLPVIMIVGQLRASAIDLLRAAGSDEVESLGLVEEALGLPPV